jgi:hypothetical protein
MAKRSIPSAARIFGADVGRTRECELFAFRVRRFRRSARDKAAVCARESKGYKGRTQYLRKPHVPGIQRRFRKMYDRALSSLPGGNSRITVFHDVLSNA